MGLVVNAPPRTGVPPQRTPSASRQPLLDMSWWHKRGDAPGRDRASGLVVARQGGLLRLVPGVPLGGWASVAWLKVEACCDR